jgi:5'/3'-nucleotidase
MFILLTNDDGYDSEGLLVLKKELEKIGDVAVLAPDHNWSASGHSRTLRQPLRVFEAKLRDGSTCYTSDGTPSDCVALVILGYLKRRPDIIVSGVNRGANLGDDITYSGTVAAAMEGAIYGIPSIAVSSDGRGKWHFDTAAQFTARLVQEVATHRLPAHTLLNVNTPNLPPDKVQGVEITHMGHRFYQDELVERIDPFGQKYYWTAGEPHELEQDDGTDVGAIANGKISVTPIHLDLTNHRIIEELKGWGLER